MHREERQRERGEGEEAVSGAFHIITHHFAVLQCESARWLETYPQEEGAFLRERERERETERKKERDRKRERVKG